MKKINLSTRLHQIFFFAKLISITAQVHLSQHIEDVYSQKRLMCRIVCKTVTILCFADITRNKTTAASWVRIPGNVSTGIHFQMLAKPCINTELR